MEKHYLRRFVDFGNVYNLCPVLIGAVANGHIWLERGGIGLSGFSLLLSGFASVLTVQGLLLMIGGLIGGIIVGALPGLSATMGVALLIPLSFGMDPVNALVLLIAVYCGAIYGGSVSAILLRTTGTPAAAATVFDGHPMAARGEAGRALGWAAVASMVGGLLSAIVLTVASPQIAKVALQFSAPEYFALAVFGLSMIVSISGKDLVKGFISACLGLLVATIGTDPLQGYPRFAFGQMNLYSGVSVISVLIGHFAITEVIRNVETILRDMNVTEQRIENVVPSFKEFISKMKVMIGSSVIGTFVGALPAAGADLATLVAYDQARRFSKNPEKFGTGHVDGVIAAEAANNAVTGGAMIPLLTLGIPGDSVTAVLLGALMIHGLRPGPLLLQDNAATVYAVFAGLFLVNIFLGIAGLVGAPYFARVLNVSKRALTPIILLLCFVGSFAVQNNVFDMRVTLLFGILGYLMLKVNIPVAPMVLGFVLGPIAENNMRMALTMTRGDYSVFFTRPISVVFLALAVLSVLYSLYSIRKDNVRVTEQQNAKEL